MAPSLPCTASVKVRGIVEGMALALASGWRRAAATAGRGARRGGAARAALRRRHVPIEVLAYSLVDDLPQLAPVLENESLETVGGVGKQMRCLPHEGNVGVLALDKGRSWAARRHKGADYTSEPRKSNASAP